MDISAMDVLGHLGFLLIALSFLVRDMVWLRTLSVVSQVVLIVYNYFGPPEPLWLVIAWSLAFLGINLVQIWALFNERRGVQFSEREQALYTRIFSSLSPIEYMKLLRLGQWKTVEAGTTLALAGRPLNDVLFIYDGGATVQRDGQVLARLSDGAFIGEMEFFSHKAATATVVVDAPTTCLSWSQADLRRLLTRNPAMTPAIQAAFSADMVQKLSFA
jgi:hypothetical protein